MIYLFETELNKNKSIIFSLQKIFGIGYCTSKKICLSLGFSLNMKASYLDNFQYSKIVKKITSLKLIISNDLKKQIILNNTRYVNIRAYKGLRKLQGLPIRGQRTHTNAKTARKRKKL